MRFLKQMKITPLLVVLPVTSCLYTKPIQRPPIVEYVVECADTSCSWEVTISIDALIDCYDEDTSVWAEDGADFLLTCANAADDGASECVVYVGPYQVIGPDECCTDEDVALGDGCCPAPNLSSVPGAEQDSLDALEEINALCHVAISSLQICTDIDDPTLTDEACAPPETDMQDAGSEYELSIDDTLSTLVLTNDGTVSTSYVSGFGGAATAPSRFVLLQAFATDLSIGGVVYQDIQFALDADVLIDTANGDFRVPVSEESGLTIWTTSAGQPGTYGMVLEQDAIGIFDVAGGVWSLDYTNADPDYSLKVHLEGALTGMSAP